MGEPSALDPWGRPERARVLGVDYEGLVMAEAARLALVPWAVVLASFPW